jgi:hypothetical protein
VLATDATFTIQSVYCLDDEQCPKLDDSGKVTVQNGYYRKFATSTAVNVWAIWHNSDLTTYDFSGQGSGGGGLVPGTIQSGNTLSPGGTCTRDSDNANITLHDDVFYLLAWKLPGGLAGPMPPSINVAMQAQGNSTTDYDYITHQPHIDNVMVSLVFGNGTIAANYVEAITNPTGAGALQIIYTSPTCSPS